jgi:hypothetical protein
MVLVEEADGSFAADGAYLPSARVDRIVGKEQPASIDREVARSRTDGRLGEPLDLREAQRVKAAPQVRNVERPGCACVFEEPTNLLSAGKRRGLVLEAISDIRADQLALTRSGRGRSRWRASPALAAECVHRGRETDSGDRCDDEPGDARAHVQRQARSAAAIGSRRTREPGRPALKM